MRDNTSDFFADFGVETRTFHHSCFSGKNERKFEEVLWESQIEVDWWDKRPAFICEIQENPNLFFLFLLPNLLESVFLFIKQNFISRWIVIAASISLIHSRRYFYFPLTKKINIPLLICYVAIKRRRLVTLFFSPRIKWKKSFLSPYLFRCLASSN